MLVIVLLILSASAIAMPPWRLSSFSLKLQTRGGKKAVTKANFNSGVYKCLTGQREEEGPYLMLVIVLLILSASAIAMPPSGPRSFSRKL
jgi:hypothetical protein